MTLDDKCCQTWYLSLPKLLLAKKWQTDLTKVKQTQLGIPILRTTLSCSLRQDFTSLLTYVKPDSD